LEGKKRFTVAKKGSHLEKWVTLGKREVSLGIESNFEKIGHPQTKGHTWTKMKHKRKQRGQTQKSGSHLKNGSYLKKGVHTWKNGSHLEK